MNQPAPSTRKLIAQADKAMARGNGNEAVSLYQQVLQLNPKHAFALHQMGFICHNIGQYQQAEDFYRQAILSDPQQIESYVRLSSLYQSQNKGNDAVAVMERAIAVAPQNMSAHAMLVSLFLHFQHAHIVPAYLEKLFPTIPENLELLQFYCFALKMNGDKEAADKVYADITARYRVPAAFRIIYEAYMPRVAMSVAEIDETRAALTASLDRFIEERPRVQLDLLSFASMFQLAYHNRDNKAIYTKFRIMMRLIAPELNYTAPHCKSGPEKRKPGKLRIGFLSPHMHDHSVGRCYRNVMVHLARQPDMEVALFISEGFIDDTLRQVQDVVKMVMLPKHIVAAQNAVAAYELDILIYPDVGMNMNSAYMAMARLATYQCCFPGHPETTGIDTMDYFISSKIFEPDDNAQKNYTETLLLNDGVDTFFQRPIPPARWLSRKELGLPEDKKLYLCPMAIQKFHPDFDDALAAILKKDPQAMLVLFRDFQEKAASDRLQARLLAKCPADRIIFIGWQPLETLFSLMKTADAVLSTIHFGAGTTAQYAFAFGIPMVSMPGTHAGSRVVHGYYKVMDISEPPTAYSIDDYAQMAVRVAHDADYKAALSAQLLERNHILFDNKQYEYKVVGLMKDIMAQKLESYRQ